ncbi:MAG: hypothetical protein JW748_02240 [Anaerolineales bacterium]|nr:hypothetical protein [Anaerolineales bacterium]
MESKGDGLSRSEPRVLSDSHITRPQFLLAQDGNLYLTWMGMRNPGSAYQLTSGEWTTIYTPLEYNHDFWFGEAFLDESESGSCSLLLGIINSFLPCTVW